MQYLLGLQANPTAAENTDEKGAVTALPTALNSLELPEDTEKEDSSDPLLLAAAQLANSTASRVPLSVDPQFEMNGVTTEASSEGKAEALAFREGAELSGPTHSDLTQGNSELQASGLGQFGEALAGSENSEDNKIGKATNERIEKPVTYSRETPSTETIDSKAIESKSSLKGAHAEDNRSQSEETTTQGATPSTTDAASHLVRQTATQTLDAPVMVANPNATAMATERTPLSEVVDRVQTLASQGGGKMTVALSPPELGNIEIQVTARGKRIELELKSENAASKSLLESQLGDLRQSLHAQDLVLSKFEVSVTKDMTSSPTDLPWNLAGGGERDSRPFQSFSQFQDSGSGSRAGLSGSFSRASSALARVSETTRPTAQRVAGNSGVDLRI